MKSHFSLLLVIILSNGIIACSGQSNVNNSDIKTMDKHEMTTAKIKLKYPITKKGSVVETYFGVEITEAIFIM